MVKGITIDDSSLNRIKKASDMVDISNNIAKITYNLSEISKNSPKNIEINETVSKNYFKMKNEIGRYNFQNFEMS